MSVLSYRVRRFIRHNLTWHNIRFQWAIIGLAVFTLVNLVAHPLPLYVKLPLLIAGGMITAQFWIAAIFFPYPTNYPWAVKKYDDLNDWWSNISKPAGAGMFEGKNVLERWSGWDFRCIYDQSGHLIATEQKIDWSDTDPDWRPGDPNDVQTIITPHDGTERLPLIARLRSPKLPLGPQADIIAASGEVVGQTPYTLK